MSNNTVDIITFFVYPDGIARHTYGLNGIVKYDVIALYPKSMFIDVLEIITTYKVLFSKTNKISVTVADCLPINRSSFASEYGLKNNDL